MTALTILKLLYGLAVLTAATTCWITVRRLRSAHPDTRSQDLAAAVELPSFGTPFSRVRRDANRAVVRGEAVDDPRTAYVADLTARTRIRHFEKHWPIALILVGTLLNLPRGADDILGAQSPGREYVQALFLVLVLVLAVVGPLHIRRTVRNARRAVEANAERADAHAAVIEVEEACARVEYESAEADRTGGGQSTDPSGGR